MLVLHEVHRVLGAREDEFEAAYRDALMPALAASDSARLLYFLHHAHGTGRAYQVVTLTAVRDGAAWEALARRLHDGDLQTWARDVDRLRHEVTGKVLLPVTWSPMTDLDLTSVPTTDERHALTLFMEDTAWPHQGMLDDYLEAVRAQYAPALADDRRARALLELLAVLRPAWGSGRQREVVLWQRVNDLRGLAALISSEVPSEHRAPGTWMHDALAVRDDWESRLLRTTAWSPLY